MQVSPTYLTKTYQFILSCYQASIVTMFNSQEFISAGSIKEKIGISDCEIKECLMKLCNPKTGIMTKENPKKPTFLPDEKLKLNLKYQTGNIRFNFVPVQTAKQLTEGGGSIRSVTEIDAEVAKNRAMIVDAVVVRIMKSRKTCLYNDLLTETIKQILLFKAQPSMIKKRIESLIERDYLERDPSNKSKFIYKP